MPRTKGGFRTQSLLHALTYSQCDVPLEEMMRQLKEKAGERWAWALICDEDHAPKETPQGFSHGGVHRHVMEEYVGKFETVDARFWDISAPRNALHEHKEKCTEEVCVYHPKFEKVKSKAGWLKYCMEDGKYIYEGEYKGVPFNPLVYLDANCKKQSYGFTQAANAIYKEGKTLRQVHDENPGFYVREKRKLEEYAKQVEKWKEQDVPKPVFPGIADVEPDDIWPPKIDDDEEDINFLTEEEKERGVKEWQPFVDWVNKNFLTVRKRRQLQLFLYGPGGLAKSQIFDTFLAGYFKVYPWIYSDRQERDLVDCDFILVDEFKGGIPAGQLKLLAQMAGTFTVLLRYGGGHTVKKNVPLVVISNLEPKQTYKNLEFEDLETTLSRFLKLHVTTRFHPRLRGQEDGNGKEEVEDGEHSEESLEERRKRRKK